MKRISIKLRITLWFTLFMLMLVGVVFGFMVWEGEREVLRDAKHILTDVVLESVSEIENDDGGIEIDDLDFFQNGVYLTVLRDGGDLLYGRTPTHFDQDLSPDDGGIRTRSDPNGESWYVLDVPHVVKNGEKIWVRGIMSTAAGGVGAFEILRYLLMIILPFLVAVAAVGGYLLANRAFRPVRRIAASAERIAEGDDLKERIGLTGGKDEIYTLAATFDGMLARLEASFERERQFASDVSHELRTPAAVMISQCEYALENAKTREEALAALEVVLGEAEHMSTLVSQLLFLSRADRGRLVLSVESFCISELFETVAEQITETAEKKGMTVFTDIAPSLWIEADETMLMRMLLNLCDNAVKYGKEGGRIELLLREDKDEIVGEVRDDGVGIPKEQLERIWDRFYQVDPARSSDTEGVGLGLSMVKSIAEAHGGEVSVQSELGVGSVFTFRFPVKK